MDRLVNFAKLERVVCFLIVICKLVIFINKMQTLNYTVLTNMIKVVLYLFMIISLLSILRVEYNKLADDNW